MQTWTEALGKEKQQPYFRHIIDTVKAERESGQTVYPPAADVFNAFKATEFGQVKAIILGQDPYHGAGQAEGLAFSVPPGIAVPPSLVNIKREIADDLGRPSIIEGGELLPWVEQGVLLLNTTLTVRSGEAASHQGLGWETFTDAVIQLVSQRCDHVVFLLWGSPARRKAAMIDATRHCILEAPHPSPLSAHRGFFGCRHFSRANAYLQQQGLAPIQW